ncbi:phage tail sheath protein [Pseudoroseomonas deserti]|uniref:Phage tail sheath protein n=1 Tax=Teichococcus deserti TaxID=1817963 RepID=A0A1V2H768_9PROT|nr:phage tail sheath C-terminal domain-containing protein [Pseudoroseomonas deserti]ONG58576.1 phage tail sheath protein [Pseudoroseomonas deserti]
MAETFVSANLVLPGTYIRVRSEGLIGVGGISAGNIGIVGKTGTGGGATVTLSTAAEVEAAFGTPAVASGALNLAGMLGELYRNGARTVFARGVANNADQAAYTAAFNELVKEDVQILVAPDLTTAQAIAVLPPILETAENAGHDIMAVIGGDGADAAAVEDQAPTDDRVVFTAPGYFIFNPADPDTDLALPGTYMAGPVAGLLSSLAPHVSPTNKVLPGVTRLTQRYTYAQRIGLTQNRTMALEQRGGIRVVRGLTTDNAGFTQVTTRRIVDFAKAGIRKASDPFIGNLNNERVRAALAGAIDGFLTSMRIDEQLTAYQLEVTATRRDEIEGRAVVSVLLQPTFSIDFVAVTIVLQ